MLAPNMFSFTTEDWNAEFYVAVLLFMTRWHELNSTKNGRVEVYSLISTIHQSARAVFIYELSNANSPMQYIALIERELEEYAHLRITKVNNIDTEVVWSIDARPFDPPAGRDIPAWYFLRDYSIDYLRTIFNMFFNVDLCSINPLEEACRQVLVDRKGERVE